MRDTQNTTDQELALIKAVAYELKKPLAHIHGLSCQLENGKLQPEDIAQNYSYLKETSKRMQILIDSLIFLGQVQNNQLKLDFDTINPSSIIREVANDLKPTANHYHKTVDLNFSNSLKPVNANHDAFTYAIFNLMDTTIRTSQSEVIEMNVKRDGENCLITIKDVGENLNRNHLNNIEDNLLRNLQSVASLGASSGLGVYVAKSLGQTFRGELNFANAKGRRVINMRVPNSLQLSFI